MGTSDKLAGIQCTLEIESIRDVGRDSSVYYATECKHSSLPESFLAYYLPAWINHWIYFIARSILYARSVLIG